MGLIDLCAIRTSCCFILFEVLLVCNLIDQTSWLAQSQAFYVPGVSQCTVASNMVRNHICYTEIMKYRKEW